MPVGKRSKWASLERVLKQAKGLPSHLYRLESSEALAVGLPSTPLPPHKLAQKVCVGVEGAGKKEKQLFSFGISTWFCQ